MAEEIDNMRRVAREVEKLPTRKERGHPDNIIRALAAGFVFMGYDADVAVKRAKLVQFFYDTLWEVKDEQSH